MRTLPILLLLSVLTATRVLAIPTVSLHWESCPFPASEDWNRYDDGTSHRTITVTAHGLSGPIRGFDLGLALKAQERGVGDAWRFDDGGCNAGRVAFNQVSASDPCPYFAGPNEQTFYRTQYLAEIDFSGYFGAAEGLLTARTFDAIVAEPDQTYTLARFDMDLGTSCGCRDRAMCIRLFRFSYLDGDGQEQFLAYDGPYLTWNDPYVSACSAPLCGPAGCGPSPSDTLCAGTLTPAANRSWGKVKAWYR